MLLQLIIAANRLLGTFRDLWVLTNASAQRQGDVREVASRVGQTLGTTVCRGAANRLGRLGSRPPPRLDPVFRNLLRLTENTDRWSRFTQQESLSCINSCSQFYLFTVMPTSVVLFTGRAGYQASIFFCIIPVVLHSTSTENYQVPKVVPLHNIMTLWLYSERIPRFVPFWEVPGNNIRFKCIQVIQVNVFRSLMLTPLPHTFMKARQETSTQKFAVFIFFFPTSFSFNLCIQKQGRLRQSMNWKPHPSC